MKPEVGDIWFNHLDKYHYLILKDDVEMGIGSKSYGYTMLVLEEGRIDSAWADHFNVLCHYVC